MNVFISADLEGIACVVHGEHVRRDGKEHERARELMTEEVNAAVEGALEASAEKIVVNDSHGTMKNIIPEKLHEKAQLITGTPKPLGMMQGIDPTFHAAFFIGYHTMPSTFPGIMGHAYHGRVVFNISVNGRQIGELGLNAAIAGYFGVPVALVTGDNAVAEEAKKFRGNIKTVIVKKAIGRYAAQCLVPSKARKLIKEGAVEALKSVTKFKPFRIEPPIRFEITFMHTGMTEMAELIPKVKRLDDRTLTYTSDDLIEAFKTFRAMIALAGTNI